MLTQERAPALVIIPTTPRLSYAMMGSYALCTLFTVVCTKSVQHLLSILYGRQNCKTPLLRFITHRMFLVDSLHQAIHTAPSIEGPWTYNGALLPEGSSIDLPGNQDLWVSRLKQRQECPYIFFGEWRSHHDVYQAPDVVYSDGNYYVYYSVSTFGVANSAIGVAVSSDMESGTWTDLGATGVQSSDGSTDYNAIDAAVFQDGNTWVMYFGSWWSGLFAVDMQSPPTAVAEGSAPVNVIQEPVTTAVEAPYLYKHSSSDYFMFYSQGRCCGYDEDMPPPGEEYKIMVCKSSSAYGPFVDSSGVSCLEGGGTVVLESHGFVYGAGHQGIFNDPTLGPVSSDQSSKLPRPSANLSMTRFYIITTWTPT